jgi:hypothetical protein
VSLADSTHQIDVKWFPICLIVLGLALKGERWYKGSIDLSPLSSETRLVSQRLKAELDNMFQFRCSRALETRGLCRFYNVKKLSEADCVHHRSGGDG